MLSERTMALITPIVHVVRVYDGFNHSDRSCCPCVRRLQSLRSFMLSECTMTLIPSLFVCAITSRLSPYRQCLPVHRALKRRIKFICVAGSPSNHASISGRFNSSLISSPVVFICARALIPPLFDAHYPESACAVTPFPTSVLQ